MQDLASATRISPGSKVDLAEHKPDAKLGLGDEATARAHTAKRAERMTELATMLMPSTSAPCSSCCRAWTPRARTAPSSTASAALNPMSVRVAGFKAPNSTELAHDFLWRIHQVLPQRGEIGIFNRSHYEDVLVVRVEELVPKAVWKQRYDAINAFEEHLANEGTTVVKLFLHISEDEQAKRFRERIADPAKNWKFSPTTSPSARKWDEYMTAYRAMLEQTSTKAAPWHVVPADHKWVRDAVVTEVLTQTLEGLDLEVARARARAQGACRSPTGSGLSATSIVATPRPPGTRNSRRARLAVPAGPDLLGVACRGG